MWARPLSTSAAEAAREEAAASKDNVASTAAATAEAMQAAKAEAVQAAKEGGKSPAVSSYWGIVPAKLVNKDGAEWKWSCFRVLKSSAYSLCR